MGSSMKEGTNVELGEENTDATRRGDGGESVRGKEEKKRNELAERSWMSHPRSGKSESLAQGCV